MNNNDIISKLVSSLSKFAEDSEKLFLPTLSFKLASAIQKYPEDHTLGMVNGVISRMSGNNKLEISRAEFKDLYEKFYTRNSKFASVFAEEIGNIEEVVAKPEASQDDGSLISLQDSYENSLDPVIAGSMAQLFGGEGKFYSQSAGKKAVNACNLELQSMALPGTISILNGKRDIIICSASFETPKGETSILIPVELVDDKAITPNMFVGNEGTEELNKSNVIAYVRANAGKLLKITHNELLEAALTAKGNVNDISDVDLAFIKFSSSADSKDVYLTSNQVLGQEVEAENKNLVLDMPQIEDPDLTSVSRNFETELGLASYKFGNKVIRQGRALIENVISQCNIADMNVAVAASDDNSITYAISLNGGSAGFKVPVQVVANCALPPDTFICSGSIETFDRKGILEVLQSNQFDRRAAVAASPQYGLRGDELVSIVRQAMKEENYAKAEDAINVLAEMEDTKAYELALSAFSSGLLKKTASTEAEHKCNLIVNSKNSQYDTCGHTGLPLHKVFQNKQGECLPLYRKGMEETYDGATFLNKIYL